jgi:hypothetical protein
MVIFKFIDYLIKIRKKIRRDDWISLPIMLLSSIFIVKKVH